MKKYIYLAITLLMVFTTVSCAYKTEDNVADGSTVFEEEITIDYEKEYKGLVDVQTNGILSFEEGKAVLIKSDVRVIYPNAYNNLSDVLVVTGTERAEFEISEVDQNKLVLESDNYEATIQYTYQGSGKDYSIYKQGVIAGWDAGLAEGLCTQEEYDYEVKKYSGETIEAMNDIASIVINVELNIEASRFELTEQKYVDDNGVKIEISYEKQDGKFYKVESKPIKDSREVTIRDMNDSSYMFIENYDLKENGEEYLLSRREIKNGIFVHYVYYFENGNVKAESFIDENVTGIQKPNRYISYYENGQIKQIRNYDSTTKTWTEVNYDIYGNVIG